MGHASEACALQFLHFPTGVEGSACGPVYAMVWMGVILRRRTGDKVEYCVEFDKKRTQWELPKGGKEDHHQRQSSGCVDASPFATARWELWEKAGVWLSWRWRHCYAWVTPIGEYQPPKLPVPITLTWRRITGYDFSTSQSLSEPGPGQSFAKLGRGGRC